MQSFDKDNKLIRTLMLDIEAPKYVDKLDETSAYEPITVLPNNIQKLKDQGTIPKDLNFEGDEKRMVVGIFPKKNTFIQINGIYFQITHSDRVFGRVHMVICRPQKEGVGK